MQVEMISAMKFWIETCDIDGFRCDMAHLVPLQFWKKARTALQATKSDLFWLAECEEISYHKVFDATYTWKWMHETEQFYQNKINKDELFSVLQQYNDSFPQDALRAYFTSNHDENTWNGTEYEKYGNAAKAFAVFSCMWNGIPLIYSGQELPNLKRLPFFDKDFIEWKDECALHQFYKTLLNLRKTNSALRAGDINVVTYIIETESKNLFSFLRKNKDDEVLVILNLSGEKSICKPYNEHLTGKFINVFDKNTIDFSQEKNIKIQGWDYKVYEKQKPSK